MDRKNGLSRNIVQSVTAITMATTLLVIFCADVLYTILWNIAPGAFPTTDSLMPSEVDWGVIFTVTLLSLGVAVILAIRLARRIMTPLNSVATGLRAVANGDLTARASAGKTALGEATQLVSDFNAMAERLARMADEQAYWNAAISHELRTPVTILRGRLQGLTDGVFEPSPALFRSLLSQVEGLGRMIEDLHVAALADNDRLKLQWESVEIADEVETVVQAMTPGLQDKGFSLALALTPGQAHCDPVRIRQALMALLDNVSRHATPGLVRIAAGIDQDTAFLRIEDSGPGIPPELVPRIFLAFQQGRDTTSGSGLGLSVVQAIAHAHRGEVSYRTTERGGALFAFTWPA